MIGNYNELTIRQFLECKTIADLEEDPIERNVKMLASITGKSQDEIEELPIEDLKKQLENFSKIEKLNPNEKLKLNFKIKGKRFSTIWKTQELTAAQYIDACHFCKDPNSILNNIHNILASICVERSILGKTKPYNSLKHKEHSDLFYNEMKIKDAYPIMLFFCRYFKELETNILTFLEEESNKMIEKHKEVLASGGAMLQP